MGLNLKNQRDWLANLTVVMQLGLTMAGSIVFCFLVGLYLDRWLGAKGILIAVFTILGVIGGAITCYRQIREITEHDKRNDQDPKRRG